MGIKMELLDAMDCRPLGRKTGIGEGVVSPRLKARLEAARARAAEGAEQSLGDTTDQPKNPSDLAAE